jgi:SP family sugar:H+ symporter-like MFS transporter
MIGFLTPFANDGISYGFGYVFFGTNLAAALLTYFFLYETKALSLENVDAMYSDMSIKPWKSDKWVPAGYIDRNTRDETYWQRRPSVLDDRKGLEGDSPLRSRSQHHERISLDEKRV